MFTNSLRSLVVRRDIEAAKLLMGKRPDLSRLALSTTEQLTVDEGGTLYPVFVLAAHDPDASTARWVP